MTKGAVESGRESEIVVSFEGSPGKVIGVVVGILRHFQKANVLGIEPIRLKEGEEDQVNATVEGRLDPVIHFIGALLGMKPNARIKRVEPYELPGKK